MDSLLSRHPMLAGKVTVNDFEVPHLVQPQTMDFYLLLFLCLMLGMVRFMDFKYLPNIWRALRNPSMGNNQIKDQLQGAGLQEILMNIFFTMILGLYIYYTVKFFIPYHAGSIIPSSLLVFMLMLGMGIMYFIKYLVIRFSGWAFRIEDITEQYLFNVFLINKVLAIVLLPMVIFLAFANYRWAEPILIVSFVATGILVLNRYVRTWQAFGSFFQYSKFHFFFTLRFRNITLGSIDEVINKGLSVLLKHTKYTRFIITAIIQPAILIW